MKIKSATTCNEKQYIHKIYGYIPLNISIQLPVLSTNTNVTS